ncbi:hypothetical protein [Robertkochia flava]|uniref:hypothetical protein n=1 Tax=Robertkochia flava TaxID=3447986 RepID=UPI001CCA6A69|nr:hypothetical protein [Robertkochia marina]
MKSKHSHNSKDEGFKFPQGYFEGLEARAKSAAAFKEAIPDEEGFEVPEQYFAGFEVHLRKRMRGQTPVLHFLQTYRKYGYYAAAAVCLILISTLFTLDVRSTPVFSELKTSDIEWLLDSGMLEIPESYLMENPVMADISAINFSGNTIEPNALESYLLDELDIYDLTE